MGLHTIHPRGWQERRSSPELPRPTPHCESHGCTYRCSHLPLELEQCFAARPVSALRHCCVGATSHFIECANFCHSLICDHSPLICDGKLAEGGNVHLCGTHTNGEEELERQDAVNLTDEAHTDDLFISALLLGHFTHATLFHLFERVVCIQRGELGVLLSARVAGSGPVRKLRENTEKLRRK